MGEESNKGSVNLEVQYIQTDDGREGGCVILAINGQTQTKYVEGRLDKPHDVITARGFVYAPSEAIGYDISVTCKRTSATLMNVSIIFAGPPKEFYDTGTSDGNYYPPSTFLFEKIIEDVPISLGV